MFFSLPARRVLAGIASALLLLCQSAMAAQSCGVAQAAAAQSSLNEHCHGTAPRSGDEPGHGLQQACPSDYASASVAKLDVPQFADLPVLMIHPGSWFASARDEPIPTAIPARAEPPPLTIVHYCLRN